MTLLACIGGLAAASSALATPTCEGCAPWWHLNAGARPTYLDPTAGHPATDQVQEILTSEVIQFRFRVEGAPPVGEAGEYFSAYPFDSYFATEPLAASEGTVPLTAENLQKGLEEKDEYGPGNVTVKETTEGANGKPLENGEKRFVITTSSSTKLEIFEKEDGEAQTKVVTEGTKAKPDGQLFIDAANLGDAGANGETNPVIIKDKLPAGVTAIEYEAVAAISGAGDPVGQVTCELQTLPAEPGTVTCKFVGTTEGANPQILPPYGQIEIRIGVDLGSEAHTGELNKVSVAGGGASRRVSIARPIRLVEKAGEATPFGFESYEVTPENEDGTPAVQAGSHPFQTTFTIDLNEGEFVTGLTGEPEVEPAGGLIKDFVSKLPPGVIGNPTPFARCTLPDFQEERCPANSIVGVSTVRVNEPTEIGLKTFHSPVYNLEPVAGEPARFGFLPTKETPIFINASVRNGEDYGVTTETSNIVEVAPNLRAQVTFWGVPGDPRHAASYAGCLEPPRFGKCQSEPEEVHNPPPFFALPTSCSGHPLESEAEADSWTDDPGHFEHASTSEAAFSEQPMVELSGCNQLPFEPSLEVKPDDTFSSSPTGLNVKIHIPQEGQLNGQSVAQSALRETVVALPPGFAVNPSASDGLEACSEGLVGYQGMDEFDPFTEPGIFSPKFLSYLPGTRGAVKAGDTEILKPGENFCPNASKIGSVTIKSPLLPVNQPLTGYVYLAAQEANPFKGLMAMYVVAEDPISGSLVKLPGEVQLCQKANEVINGITCEALGQIVTKFKNTPQLAFEDFEAHFFGGERAPLASPTRCGTYTTKATFVPWSAEPATATSPGDEAEVTVHSTSSYTVTNGPNGSACPGASLPFKPSLTGGALNLQSGAFSPFTLSMTRANGEQNMQSVEAHLPEGLSGLLSNVELCPEPQADSGQCGPNSLIGEATVGVGVGGDPYTVSGGKFFLTGPYNGSGGCTVGQPGCAPFGITFEVPAKAGPFDLAHTAKNHPPCDCIVTRGKIEINKETSALTITSNPPGTPYSIPTELEGIPLEIQHINATTTRSAFQFNPTNCAKMEVTGTIHSSEGGTDNVNVPFQVTNCTALKFEPKFSVGTSGKTSKAKGASLTAKVTYPNVPQGTDADIARVKVDLPKQLPSRLTTLQKACTDKQFEANPAACPSASKIGYAVVHTPLLPVPLEGPAIFVSHGGEAFPSLTMVLQGYGVTIDLVGTTFISKSGITSTTFKTVPDQPFSTFTLTLPEGNYSALAANGNLCAEASKLTMPTEFIGQNGAPIHETTKIAVSGCAKTKTRAQKLAAALKACHRDKNKGKKAKCEAAAKKHYGPLKKAKKSKGKK